MSPSTSALERPAGRSGRDAGAAPIEGGLQADAVARSGSVRAGMWLFALGLLALTIRMLFAPRIHDSALMEYLAWRIRQGDVPYRDLLDMNLPGTYLLHMAGQWLMGVGDVQMHVVDTGVMALCGWGVWSLTRPFSRTSRALAAMAPLAVHLVSGGAYDTLERDWVMAALYVAAAALVMKSGRRRWPLLAAGALLGWAVMIKPQGLLMLAAVPLLLVVAQRSQVSEGGVVGGTGAPVVDRGRLVRGAAAVFVAAGVVVAGVLTWVAVSGGWDDFTWWVRRYLPLYTRLDQFGRERSTLGAVAGATRQLLISTPVLYALLVVVLLTVFGRRLEPARRRAVQVLGVLAAVGVLHGWSGFKLWRYHFAPLQTATAALVGVLAVEVVAAARERAGGGWGKAVVPLAGVVLGAVGAVMLVQGVVAPPSDAASVRVIDHRTRAAAAVLRARSHPGDTVQVLDTYDSGMNTALRARLAPATPYVYDFYFFHDQRDPTIQEMRRDFLAAFDAARPRFVLLSKVSWGMRDGYGDVARFPELAARLKGYRVIWEDDGLRVLERSG